MDSSSVERAEARPAAGLTGGVHWKQLGNEPPRDREIYVVTDEAQVMPVSYSDEHYHYLREDRWVRTDGEPGSWELCDIEAWADNYEGAESAARQLRDIEL